MSAHIHLFFMYETDCFIELTTALIYLMIFLLIGYLIILLLI